MRDDFSSKVKDTAGRRVAFRCSNPSCGRVTSGPREDPSSAMNLGVAAHITAASEGGPRYDAYVTVEQRKSHENVIWLCQTCAKLIDSDVQRYDVATLVEWKRGAEARAAVELEHHFAAVDLGFSRVVSLMPDLIAEMSEDLSQFPLRREFVLLQKNWVYWNKGNELVYYFDDHPDLRDKIRILENHDLVTEISYNNVERFIFSEKLAVYLAT